ncbi:GNAT family N-acetyltransferase [Pseudocnuella soli]|uniref:GNAT family N-acetyltransferase n=1 Tax=Pseudocnuella soli TaxID=2502779 RepID=UPI00104744AD|nr:GNAT family N-acetyltransferase [Pseudocnuella soli]
MSIEIKEVPLLTVWHMRQTVMYPEMTLEAMKLPDDEAGKHLGLYDDNVLCSVVSLFYRGDVLQFRKFATVAHLQGKGYGTKLLQHVFSAAKKDGVQRIWCNARATALPFYQKFGMQPFGEGWLENGHEFIKMQIEL